MTTQTVTLRIVGENGQLVASVRASKAEIAGLGTASTQAGQQAQAGARGVDAIGAAAERTQKRASLLQGTLGQIKGLLAGYVGLQGVRELGRAADAYSDIVGKLKQVTAGEQELATAKAETFRISQATYQSLDATTTLYTRSAAALAQYNVGQARVAELTETVNRGLLISRATTAESASAILQLSQAMGAGALRGEEFNAVNEAAPRLMQLLADSIGRPRGELKGLAEDGKLTIDVLLKAFTGPNAAKLAEEAAAVPLTIGRAWQLAKNELLRYIGEADQASGASSQIAASIKYIGENVDSLARAVITLGKIAATVYAVQLLQSGRAWIASLIAQQSAVRGLIVAQAQWGAATAASFGMAMKSIGALGIAFNVLGAAIVGWQLGKYLREEFLQVRLAGIALVNGLLKGWEYVKQGALIAWEAMKAGFLGAVNVMRNGLADLVGFQAKLANLIPDFMGGSAVAAGLDALEGKLRTSASAADGFKGAVSRINSEAEANRRQIDQITGEMADYEIAQDAAKKATADGSAAASTQALALDGLAKKAGKTSDELKRLKEAQNEFARSVARETAELAGPQSLADFDLADGKRQGLEKLAKGEARYTDVIQNEKNLEERYRRTNEELRQRQDILGQVKAEMEEEIYLSGLSSEARRVEETVIRAVNAAKEAGKPLNAQEIADLRSYVTAADAMIQAREDQARAIDDLKGAVTSAAQSGIRAFADWFGHGFKGAKDLWKQLKDVFKRGVSDVIATLLEASFMGPIKNWASQIASGLSGGFSGAGAQGGFGTGGGMGQLFSGAMNTLTSFFGRLFGRGGAAQSAIESGTTAGFKLAQSLGVAVPGSVQQVGGVLLPNGQVAGSSFGGVGGFAGMSPWMGALGGAAMGWGLGGDTPGKIGGALAGGAVGYGLLGAGGGLAAGAAGMAAGGVFGGISGMLGALGPAGWIGLAALAVNAISGGKLFGTKAKTESGSQSFGISEAGATGSESVTTVRQKSFFRGREWKTTTTGLPAEAMAAVQELFESLKKTVTTAAQQLGVEVPDLVGGTFKREFDAKGNLTREFGTIAGRVYNEAQEAVASRLVGENLLNVAKQAGSAAELEQLANAYRTTGEELQSFAAFALAVQEDLMNANSLWKAADGDGLMSRIVQYIEGLAGAGESLADAYARVQQTISAYGDLIGGVRTQLATRGLNQYQKAQLDVELAYRAQVKQANELAKALGLTGARAEDLAAIEQLRALNMADLADQYRAQQVAQNRNFIEDLELSDLSPLRDDQKLARAMDLLRTAASANDQGRAQKLAEQVLGFGRDLYASGMDYNNLFNQVVGILDSIQPQTMEELQGLTNEELSNLADLVDGLPSRIAQELAAILVVAPPPATVNPALPPAPVPSPGPVPPSGGGGGGGGWDGDMPRCVAGTMLLDDGTAAEDASAGDVHATHDPAEGFRRHAIRVRGEAVLQPCVRIVTASGAALVCSRSTPFTDPHAPFDAPEHTTLAPDMLGRHVFVQLLGETIIDTVAAVEDAGTLPVIPLDFGGRSFPAGESADALVYSHNMMKGPGSGYGDINALVTVMGDVAATNRQMLEIERSAQLETLSSGSRMSGVL